MKILECCFVVDEEEKVIIRGGIIGDEVSKVHNGPLTHIVVGYYANEDDAIREDNNILQVFDSSS